MNKVCVLCAKYGKEKPHKARGMCTGHYQRWVRGLTGDRLSSPMKKSCYGHQHPNTTKAIKSPNVKELWWAAGFLEGDGCFGAFRQSQHVRCGQVQKEPLVKLQTMFGGNIGTVKSRQKKQQDSWMWSISGSRARGVMMTLYILMSPRRKKQIREALEWAKEV